MTEIDWAGLLVEEDVEGLWNGLYQLVSRHPAVRPLHFATDGAAVSSQTEINADLAQELFLELFQKQRFDHYTANCYNSTEIENELAHIEIPNLVGARLRKRYPESFRMARRVSSLLKTSARFRRFGLESEGEADETPAPATGGKVKRRGRPKKAAAVAAAKADEAKQVAFAEEDDDLEVFDDDSEEGLSAAKKNGRSGEPKRRRMVNQVFGLGEWPGSKAIRDSGHFTDSIKSVPMRRRDTRLVGRSGSSQLILSNPELEKLIVEVLTAIDSPADVRTLRQLVLSKIPLQDYNVASLDEELSAGNSGGTIRREATDTRETPEDALLRGEQDDRASEMAGEFLVSLRRAVNNNERRYARLLTTLWHCYYDPQGPSQLEIARLLGVSDSLVSDNRRLIEHELKKLKLSIEDGAVFSESLQRLITPAEQLVSNRSYAVEA
ncbi:MAG TPA: hypothetical protein VNI02_00160 [Blastocatellia bacterium]|jgi:hypothetical protein|nr:hypothetical protein [Blastocatellia bacterium]